MHENINKTRSFFLNKETLFFLEINNGNKLTSAILFSLFVSFCVSSGCRFGSIIIIFFSYEY